MQRNTCLHEQRHELTFTGQDCCLDIERLAVSMRQKCQEVVLGSAALERRDDLQDTNSAACSRPVGLLLQERFHSP